MKRALLVLALLTPAAALPCSIAVPFLNGISPRDGATLVPLNAEVKFLDCQGVATASLVDGAGAVVPVTTSARGPVTVLKPTAPLSADTRYTLTVTDGMGQLVTATFNTGRGVDTTPPVLSGNPVVQRFGGGKDFGSTCGRLELTRFTWPELSDDATPGPELFIEGLTGESPDALGAAPSAATQTGTLDVGQSYCRGSSIALANNTLLRARAVDWAGNFSELTEAERVKGCGCSTGAPALAVGALVLLLRRLRRR